jgi:uncharacterized membrane protein
MIIFVELVLNDQSAVDTTGPDDGSARRDDIQSTSSTTDSLKRRARSKRGRLTRAVLTMSATHAFILSTLAIIQHRNFGSWGFDLGIYDQAWWLIGQDGISADSFMTMRGLPVWGHHINAVLLLLAPFARLGFGVEFLMIVQNVVLALGALPVAWLARQRSGSDRVGVSYAAMYLLYPALGWLAWVSFHPEALAITPLLFAVWFASSARRLRAVLCLLIALSCRQDIGLVVAGLGAAWLIGACMSSVWRKQRMVLGGSSVGLGLGWFYLASNKLIPAALGSEVYYIDRFYARFGSSMGEVALNLAANPGTVVSMSTEPQAQTYLLDLFAPLGFLSMFGLPVLSALPQLLGTIVADSDFIRDVRFQYTAVMIPGLVLGALVAQTWVARRSAALGRVLLVWMLVCTGGSALLRGPVGPGGLGSWKLSNSQTSAFREAVAMIPHDASVAAADNVAPHLTHRRSVYDFPNPFAWMVFGRSEADAASPSDVNWVVVAPDSLSEKHRTVFDSLIASGGGFEVVFDRDGVVVARRLQLSL